MNILRGNRLRIRPSLGAGVFAAILAAGCDGRDVTAPAPSAAPRDNPRLNTAGAALGSNFLRPPPTSHPNDVAAPPFQPFSPIPAGSWIIVRTSGSVQSEFNDECGKAATDLWPCQTANQLSPFSSTFPSTVGPVQVILRTGTGETPVPLRGSGGGGVGLLYSSTGGMLAGRVMLPANFWWAAGHDYIAAFTFSGGYSVSAEAVPPPLEVVESGGGTGGPKVYSVVPLHGLQLINPRDPYYFQFWPAGAVTWTFIQGEDVSDDPRVPGAEHIPVNECGFQLTCSYTPPGVGRMEATAWVEGRPVTVRSVTAPTPCSADSNTAGVAALLAADCTEESPPHLSVSCTPSPVLRGANVRCVASVAPAAEMTVLTRSARGSGFSFSESPNQVVAAGDSSVWEGTAALATQVRFVVRVQHAGTTTQLTSTGNYTITARTWAPYQLTQVPEWSPHIRGAMQPFPTNGVFGNFSLNGLNPFSTPIDSVASGPNAGLMFFVDRPPFISKGATIATHPALYPPAAGAWGSPQYQQWYNDQNGTPSGTCTQAQVPQLRSQVERHEGVTQATNSHYGVANQAFMAHRPDRALEALALFKVPKERLQDRAYRIYEHFALGPAHAAQTAFDGSDYPLIRASFPCAFDNNPLNP
ncbi:hypothetical protein [Longimicrobium sp.]|uniref:hypothetical protein n=1 Tax=Longimicrobium sp. TaxID=2029185 RepID=UPI002E35F949|nr:hypothetical protein [Longimicrobium sp.]HEX6042829.1 hypothetical protein [Longimicrobium sp.]